MRESTVSSTAECQFSDMGYLEAELIIIILESKTLEVYLWIEVRMRMRAKIDYLAEDAYTGPLALPISMTMGNTLRRTGRTCTKESVESHHLHVYSI